MAMVWLIWKSTIIPRPGREWGGFCQAILLIVVCDRLPALMLLSLPGLGE